MTPTVQLDTRNFEAALRDYYRASKKDLAYVINRQALNVAIKASQQTPLADKARIEALREKPWWNKFVTKQLKAREGRPGKKTWRAAFRDTSRKLIRQRLARVAFIRAGWFPAMKKLSALKLGLRGGRPTATGRIRKPAGNALPAVDSFNPVATIINSAQGAIPVAGPALQRALNLAAADMRKYIAEKMGATARRFSSGR